MADRFISVLDGAKRRYRDMGDGVVAEVVTLATDVSGAAVDVLSANGLSIAGAQNVIPADADRKALTIRNDSDTKMYMRTDGAAADGVGYPLDAGRGYEFPPHMIPAGAISVWCSAAGKRWAAMYVTTDA